MGATPREYDYLLPVGMAPAAIEKVKDELSYALGGKVELEQHGKRVRIIVRGSQLPKKARMKEVDTNDMRLCLPIGVGHAGSLRIDMSLDHHCYMLIGGNPGTGKSNFLCSSIKFLTDTYDPEDLWLFLIDLKLGCELSPFSKLPHVIRYAFDPVGKDMKNLMADLNDEIRDRMSKFADCRVKKISEYREDRMPYIVLVIDEYAELRLHGGQWEEKIKSLLQIGRAAGLRALLATQRPTRDNISGSIKALCTDRLCFQVADALNSRVILDKDGAEALPGIPGRAILLSGAKFSEVQTYLYT